MQRKMLNKSLLMWSNCFKRRNDGQIYNQNQRMNVMDNCRTIDVNKKILPPLKFWAFDNRGIQLIIRGLY